MYISVFYHFSISWWLKQLTLFIIQNNDHLPHVIRPKVDLVCQEYYGFVTSYYGRCDQPPLILNETKKRSWMFPVLVVLYAVPEIVNISSEYIIGKHITHLAKCHIINANLITDTTAPPRCFVVSSRSFILNAITRSINYISEICITICKVVCISCLNKLQMKRQRFAHVEISTDKLDVSRH